MKYYSDKTNKLYESLEEVAEAERKYDAEIAEKRATEAARSKEKKALADKIEAAEEEITLAYKHSDEVKQQVKELLEQTNETMAAMLQEASTKIEEAEKKKHDLVKEFNKLYGAYTVKYTNDRAEKEWEKLRKAFDFGPFGLFDFLL